MDAIRYKRTVCFRNMSSTVRDLRKQQGFSLDALARQLGVSVKAVQHWESGRSAPTKANRQRLAKALNVSPKELALTLERERQIYREREANLTQLADRVSISNVEQEEEVPK